MSVQRFDRSELRKPKKTREGFLRADAYLGRAGIQRYRRADGSEQLELRPPEEVFKADALESFAHATVTREHPPRFVTTDNWRDVSVGHVGDQVVRDDMLVKASLIVTDPQLISEMERGERVECSGGYTCDLEMKPGEWNGQKYDCVQRNIVGNHVAIVTKGRAGPEVRVRLDAEDAIDSTLSVARDDDNTGTDRSKGGPDMGMVKHRIDGVEYDVSEQAKQALERDAGRTDAKLAALAQETKAATEAKAKADAEVIELKKKLDEAEKAKKDAVDPEKVAAAVKARVSLERAVGSVLGEKVKLDDMSEKDIVVAVLKKADKDFDATGKSEEYLKGRFDEALKSLKKKDASPIERARGMAIVASGAHEDDADEDPLAKSLAAYRKRNHQAWLKHDAEESREAE